MLQTDALYTFKEVVEILDEKRHRIVGKLLRDILESIHLIEYLNSASTKAESSLEEWFNDNIVMHREYREFIKARDGKDAAEYQKNLHRLFSKFTHRSYKTLLYGYILAGDDCIHYDYKWTLPQTVSMYYAFLGHFGSMIVENLKAVGLISKDEVDKIWNKSMEGFQIPRSYLSPEDMKFLGIEDDEGQCA
ncbi:MAG TPA: hypothetical protein PKD85_03425 [Saprospiraceae bacterium]|nr:hypothetical protein [Saprospiraceae bacterium]